MSSRNSKKANKLPSKVVVPGDGVNKAKASATREAKKRPRSQSVTPEMVTDVVKSKKHKKTKETGVKTPSQEKGAGQSDKGHVRAEQKSDKSRTDSQNSEQGERPPSRYKAASVSPVRTRSRSRSRSKTPVKTVQFVGDESQEELDYNDDIADHSVEAEEDARSDKSDEPEQINNSASISDDSEQGEQMPPNSAAVLGVKVNAMPKTITMTEDQLDQLINWSIDNYEQRRKSEERGKGDPPATKHKEKGRGRSGGPKPRAAESDSTVYEHFCDPPVTPGQGGIDVDAQQRMQQLHIDVSHAVGASGEITMLGETNTSHSDESGLLNSSDEANLSLSLPDTPGVSRQQTARDRARDRADRMYQDAEINKVQMEVPPGQSNNIPISMSGGVMHVSESGNGGGNWEVQANGASPRLLVDYPETRIILMDHSIISMMTWPLMWTM